MLHFLLNLEQQIFRLGVRSHRAIDHGHAVWMAPRDPLSRAPFRVSGGVSGTRHAIDEARDVSRSTREGQLVRAGRNSVA